MSKDFEEILAAHSGPTLLGVKSANLINFSISRVPNIYKELDELKNVSKVINYYILSSKGDNRLVLIYNGKMLEKILYDKKNYLYLQKHNYPKNIDLKLYLKYLKKRINNAGNFPHEIGVFLNYDLDDVIDFEQKEKKCLMIGCWKVFSNQVEKEKIFKKYNDCRNYLLNEIGLGNNLKSLID